ncbi:MAG TPA: EAL domain-containing protein [Acidimicrobiales bacterium]|nr:EAL domain-containing protein [Acidimicrobiales bacterium]
MAVVTGLLFATWIRTLPRLPTPVRIPWLAVVFGFALADIAVVHVESRSGTHSISLSDIPLALGLFFITPTHLLLARLLGSVLALVVHRRSSPARAAFALSLVGLQTCLAVAVFRTAGLPTSRIGAVHWAAAFGAVLVASLAGAAFTSVLHLLRGVRPVTLAGAKLLAASAATTALDTGLALVVISLIWRSPSTMWLLVPLTLLLLGTYKAYASMSHRYASLCLLHEFSRRVGAASGTEAVARALLEQARALLRAELAEIVLLTPAGDGGYLRLTLEGDGHLSRQPGWLTEGERAGLWSSSESVLAARTTRDEAMRGFLLARGLRDCILVPLHGKHSLVGTLMVADRIGDRGTFDRSHQALLETLANHAALSLENGRLSDQLHSAVAEREHQARHDPLTGLANRRLFHEQLVDAMDRARTADSGLAVMMLDLDRFKQVNDSLGHAGGDRLLQEVGVRLSAAVGPLATVARLGSDEFAVLFPCSYDGADASAVAREIETALEVPFVVSGLSLEVDATLGIAVFPVHGQTAEVLLKGATSAMDQAKQLKSGIAVYAGGHDAQCTRRLALVSELRAALDRDEIDVHYQPKVELRRERVSGVEALVRWDHPVRGPISPEEFVPVAEETGLIRSLTTHVLRVALRDCGQWRRAGHPIHVSVNLSPRSLLDRDLPADVAAALREASAAPEWLTFEITETSIMADPERSTQVLERLSAMGIGLAVDDFGAGHSTLTYLKQLPVDEVKIDKSFVKGMATDGRDVAIVRSVVDLGTSLGLRVVAEGVEDQATLSRLSKMGCGVAQGFHLSRPLPRVELAAWLDSWSNRPSLLARTLSDER